MAANQESAQMVAITGEETTYVSADAANGHLVPNNGRVILLVKNGGGSSINVTVKGGKYQGRSLEDQVVPVAAGAEKVMGAYMPYTFNQVGSDAGKLKIEFSDDTNVTFAILKVG